LVEHDRERLPVQEGSAGRKLRPRNRWIENTNNAVNLIAFDARIPNVVVDDLLILGHHNPKQFPISRVAAHPVHFSLCHCDGIQRDPRMPGRLPVIGNI